MKKVSVYIPCYNSGRFIGRCIESILGQTYAPAQILVIDDHSSDNSASVVRKYPVELMVNDRNGGLAACRNKAFGLAHGELVAALDADCLASADWLEKLVPLLDEDDIAGAGGRLIEENTFSLADRWRCRHMRQEWGKCIVHDPPFLFGSNTVFKKEAFYRCGPYAQILGNNYEDVDFSRRLYAGGYRLVYNPGACARHLKSDTVLSLLRNYRRWRQQVCDYGQLRHGLEKSRLREAVFCIGKLFDRTDFFKNIFWHDLNEREYALAGLDAVCLAYSLFKDAQAVARAILDGRKSQ